MAASVPAPQAIVELGVWLGRSVCYLAAGAQEGRGAHVWGIDAWDLPGERKTYEESMLGLPASPDGFGSPKTMAMAKQHVHDAGLDEAVTLHRSFSAAAGLAWIGPPVGLIYIDADHHETAVLADFASWKSNLSRDAVIVFDDHAPPFDGVLGAVRHLVETGAIVEPTIHCDRLAVTRLR